MDALQSVRSGGQPPLTSEQFTERIVQEYAQEAESVGIRACVGAAVDEVWPVVLGDQGQPMATGEHPNQSSAAPGYREHQREAVIDILHELYVEDNDVVTLSAPTGAGKSLILYAAMATVANVFNRKSFFTTPLNALIDQVEDDEFIEDEVITLKGKNNYSCVHPQDAGAPVDSAICQRTDDFECQFKEQHHESGGCPYYGRKHAALGHSKVVTNLSYLMANSMIPDDVDSKFSPREILTIDECQSIEDFALQFVQVTVSQRSVPVVWDEIPEPPKTEDVDRLAEWLRDDVMPIVRSKLMEFDAKAELSEAENDQQEDLQDFARKVQNLQFDVQENHWVATRDVDDDDWRVEFKPIFIGRFLERFLWSQGHKVILSSATIPKGGFLEEIGLDDRSVGRVEVPSTFPVERRPVHTHQTVGKMTMRERGQTIPKMARAIASIANHHDGQRGFIHAHSYKIASRLYEALPEDVRARTRVQDGDRREASLEEWLEAPIEESGLGGRDWNDDGREIGGQVFISVAMDEGISLDDWRARWQVVAKCAYPYMGPEAKRANYRMDELDDWTWYAGSAAIALQQAVGRGMRSKDDWCHTYILDKSAADLIDRNAYLFEDWFLDAVGVRAGDDLPTRY